MILSLLFAKPNTSQLTLMNYNHNSWKSLDLIKESNLWVSLIPNIINEPTLERSKYDQIYNKTINDTIDAKQINSTGMYSVDGNHQIHRISQKNAQQLLSITIHVPLVRPNDLHSDIVACMSPLMSSF